MQSRSEIVELPTGKKIIRRLDAAGNVTHEVHQYIVDGWALSIGYQFEGGRKVKETYVCDGRIASRTEYEGARRRYSDLPPADAGITDTESELRQLARKGQQSPKLKKGGGKESRGRSQKVKAAREIDRFCLELMGRQGSVDAVKWIQDKRHSLGELTPSASRQLIGSLKKAGAVAIHPCDVHMSGRGTENTGHLVVELPSQPSRRAAVLQHINDIATAEGYEHELDVGQRYAYLKLD